MMLALLWLAAFPNPTTGGGGGSGGGLPSYAYASLPAASGTIRIAKLTDRNRGVWVSNGTTWSPINGEYVFNPVDWGADPSGLTDSSTSFNNAIQAMSSGSDVGYKLSIPAGAYKLSDTIHVTRVLVMTCESANLNSTSPGCYLYPDVGVTAIIVHYGGAESPDTHSGAGSLIENISIIGTRASSWTANAVTALNSYVQPTAYSQYYFKATARSGDFKTGAVEPTWPALQFRSGTNSIGSTVSDNHVTWTAYHQTGIWLKGRAILRNISIIGISGDGVEVVADTSDTDPTNANGSEIDHMFIQTVNGNGFYAAGGDANAGQFTSIDAESYSGWGIWDSSFLGNTHTGHQAASFTSLGAYKSDNSNARNVFTGCYTESGTGDSVIKAPATWVGGIATFSTDSSGYLWQDGHISSSGSFNHVTSHGYTSFQLGDPNSNTAFFAQAYDDSQVVLTGTPLRLKFPQTGYSPGYWRFDLSNSDLTIPMMISTSQQAYTPAASVVFPSGVVIGKAGDDYSLEPFMQSDTASPVSGSFKKGDITLNRTPGAGDPLLWRCIAGTYPTCSSWEADYPLTSSTQAIDGVKTFDSQVNLIGTLVLGQDAATNTGGPNAITVRGATLLSGGTNNQNGVDLTLATGSGKGSGTPPKLILQTPSLGSSGSSLNSPVDTLTLGYDSTYGNQAAQFAGKIAAAGDIVANAASTSSIKVTGGGFIQFSSAGSVLYINGAGNTSYLRINDSVSDYFIADTSNTLTKFGVPIILKTQTAISAHSGGGQASATAITGDIAVVSTVAADHDSVKLPTCTTGKVVRVINNQSAKILDVYTPSGGKIVQAGTDLGTNNPDSIAANRGPVEYDCADGTVWYNLAH